jgi:hypothetical protein
MSLLDLGNDNPPPPQAQSNNSNLFDLLGGSSENPPASDKGATSANMDFMSNYMGGSSLSGVNPPAYQSSYQGSPQFDFGGSSGQGSSPTYNNNSGQSNPQNFTTNFNAGFQSGITLNQNTFATENVPFN